MAFGKEEGGGFRHGVFLMNTREEGMAWHGTTRAHIGCRLIYVEFYLYMIYIFFFPCGLGRSRERSFDCLCVCFL